MFNRRSVNRIAVIFCAAIILVLSQSASAQTWSGNFSTLWNSGNNWSGGIVPVAGADVTIDAITPNQPTLNVNSNPLNSITISGGTLTINAALTATTINISGTGNVVVGVGGSIIGNVNKGGTGTLSLNGGTINGSVSLTDGIFNGGGTVTGSFTQNGGTFNGGSTAFTVDSAFTQTGGEFNAGSASTSFNLGSDFIGGTFNLAAGTLFGGNVTLQGALINVTGGNFNIGSLAQSFGAFQCSGGASVSIPALNQSGGTFSGGNCATTTTNLNLSGGTFNASSGNTTINGDLTISGSGTFNAGTGTVTFGTFQNTINVPSVLTLNNMTINKTGAITNVVISSGNVVRVNGTTTFTRGRINGPGNLEVFGNVSVGSTFSGGNAQIIFTGTNVQTLERLGTGVPPTGVWTLDKLGGSVSLLTDINLDGGTVAVNLTNGTFNTNAFTLMTGGRTIIATNGYVNGALRRTFFSAGTARFNVGTAAGAAPVDVNATAGTFGGGTTFTVRANSGVLTGALSDYSITRNWSLDPSPGGITQADLTFNYLQTDVPSIAIESNFGVLRRTGVTTENLGGTIDVVNNTASITGVTAFSDWSVGALTPPPSCALPVLRGNNATSANGRAPQGSRQFVNSKYLILANEMAQSGHTGPVGSIGWRWNVPSPPAAAAPIAQSVATTGNLRVYLLDTPAAATALPNATIDPTGFTKIIDGTISIPAGIAEINIDVPIGGPGTSLFTPTPGNAVTVLFEYQTTSPLATPLGGPNVFSTTAASGNVLSTYQSQTVNGTAGTFSNFRPETRFGTFTSNDASVTQIYSYGEVPLGLASPKSIRAFVRNLGVNSLVNLPVTLDITGAEVFTDTQTIPALPGCSQSVVTFSAFSPTLLGSNSIAVSVPPDDVNANNLSSRPLDVTELGYSYKYPGTTSSNGAGFSGGSGAIIGRFSTTSSEEIADVRLEFFSASATTYRIAIYGDSGGVPSTVPIYVDAADRTVSSAGPQLITLPAPVPVGPGDFYVGIQQTNTTNFGLAFDTEIPVRSGEQYFANPNPPVAWNDLGPAGSFKYNIGINLAGVPTPSPTPTATATPTATPTPSCTVDPVVTTLADSGVGSLRQAVIDACPSSEITFALPFAARGENGTDGGDTITLTGEIAIAIPLTITGPGADQLTISGDNVGRHFSISGANIVNISGVTMTQGNGIGASDSGGCGAVRVAGATVNLIGTVITNNSAGNFGGGICNIAGTVNITDSTVSNNTALVGGSYYDTNNVSVLNIVRSTFTGNTATTNGATGGAIDTVANLSIINSTISGNTKTGTGNGSAGGILSFADVLIESSTITNNSSTGTDSAGGVRSFAGLFTIRNSIIAANVNNGTMPDVVGAFTSQGYNLIGNVGTATGFTGIADQVGTGGAGVLNPLIAPLQMNGGPTATHSLLMGSPAWDRGNSFSLTTDQRGQLRPTDFTGIANAPGGDGADIGAVEMLIPTSAGVEVSGRVFTASGSPLRNATVTMTDAAGVVRTAVTSSFGYYRFEGVPVGDSFVMSVSSRSYRFTPRVVQVLDTLTDVDFVGLE
ncbi:MAG: carboxypeptidase regulatory-like domain-containing protein [Acidobacteriota bacterium]|nr:MAG: carboxypeptidase regulatory-like domain-containing protein [Acidobacteriota bacterium]